MKYPISHRKNNDNYFNNDPHEDEFDSIEIDEGIVSKEIIGIYL